MTLLYCPCSRTCEENILGDVGVMDQFLFPSLYKVVTSIPR